MENTKDRFDIEEVNDEFIGEVLPNVEELDLTINQIKVLALLKYISRSVDVKDKDGYFYVENDFIRKVCGIGSKSTLNNAFGVLMELGYIDRKSSKIVGKASKYCVLTCTPPCTPQLYTEEVTDNQVVTENKNATCTPNCTRNCTIDIESDKDKDIESDSELYKNSESDIYNIFYKILYNILNKILEEKEKTSSIENNNKKEKDTLMEEKLQEQINQLREQNNQLQQQNEILTARLNNAAKQFKIMNNTMRELQQKNNSFEEQINELKKENKPSTTFSNEVVEGIREQSPTVKEQTPTVKKEQFKTIDAEVKPSTAFCGDAVEAKQKLSPTEEDINIEEILEYFKENFKDPQVARQREIELLREFKEARVSCYIRRDLELRLNKYIKSLELSMDKEEVPQEVKETKKEETIPTVQEEAKELPQEAVKEADEAITSRKEDKATEGKESTFVGMFQEVKSNSSVGEEKLRYQDTKTKLYYPSLEEAKAANVNPMFLYDYEVNRCVFSY